MATIGAVKIKIGVDIGNTLMQLDEALERVKKIRKLSFWTILKMRMLGIHKRTKKVTIQELIARDREYRL